MNKRFKFAPLLTFIFVIICVSCSFSPQDNVVDPQEGFRPSGEEGFDIVFWESGRKSGKIVVPSTFDRKPVTGVVLDLEYWVLESSDNVITLPATVKRVRIEAGYDSPSIINSINIPKALEELTFIYSARIKSFDVESGGVFSLFGDFLMKPIEDGYELTKVQCKSQTTLSIPISVKTIGDSAFAYLTELKSITIPDSVSYIGQEAFRGCKSLTSITIPDSVTTISAAMFRGCKSLTNIVVPDSLTSIESIAFAGCESLASFTIPDSVDSIGSRAFNSCSGLKSIIIPNSVTSIEWATFAYCTSLESVVIPNSVDRIGDGAFYDCVGLTSITIPDSVTSIGEQAFAECTGLTDIFFSGTKEKWKTVSKWKYSDEDRYRYRNSFYNVPATVVHCSDGDVEI